MNIFKAIDNFLISIEDYFDYRVRTGKWVGDVKVLSSETQKKQTELVHKTRRSKTVRFLLSLIRKFYAKLVVVPTMRKLADLCIDAFTILNNNFFEIIIILQISFLSFIFLFNLFLNFPLLFFIFFFPILFFNLYIMTALYYVLDEKLKGNSISIWNGLKTAPQMFSKLSLLTLFNLTTSFVFIISFSIIALFYSSLFNVIRIDWGNSFFYWIIVIPLLLLLLVTLFIFNIIAHQAYYIMLFEKKNIIIALKKGLNTMKENSDFFFSIYLLLCIIFIYIICWASLSLFPLGFIITFFFFIQLFLFLGFLLWKNFPPQHVMSETAPSAFDNKPFIASFIIFGVITYFAIAALSISKHTYILDFIDKTQRQYSISQQLTKYTNNDYGYTIDYPKTWTIQEEVDHSATIYNNATDTPTGGMIITIKVFPYSEPDFNKYYLARSGLLAYDTVTKNITSKISNLFIQDKYPTVEYSFVKSINSKSEYSIHYLIHKDDAMYDVSFLTYDKNVQGDNLDLFEAIINSLNLNP